MELGWQDGTSFMVLSAAVDSKEPTMVDDVMECLRELDKNRDAKVISKIQDENRMYRP